MKSPDEIKRGLEVCNIWMVDEPNRCRECTYFCVKDCADTLMADALAYIKRLEAENVALRVALARADYHADCDNCKHRDAVDLCREQDCDCAKCVSKCVCGCCQDGSEWTWKGDGCHEQ